MLRKTDGTQMTRKSEVTVSEAYFNKMMRDETSQWPKLGWGVLRQTDRQRSLAEKLESFRLLFPSP